MKNLVDKFANHPLAKKVKIFDAFARQMEGKTLLLRGRSFEIDKIQLDLEEDTITFSPCGARKPEHFYSVHACKIFPIKQKYLDGTVSYGAYIKDLGAII